MFYILLLNIILNVNVIYIKIIYSKELGSFYGLNIPTYTDMQKNILSFFFYIIIPLFLISHKLKKVILTSG